MTEKSTFETIIYKQNKAEENEKKFWKNISDINKKINKNDCEASGGNYTARDSGHDTCDIETIDKIPVNNNNCIPPQYKPEKLLFGLGNLKSCKKPMRFDLLIDEKTLENTNDPKIKNRIENLTKKTGGKRKSKTNKRKRKTKITRKKTKSLIKQFIY
jgi:hypothetical protein